MQSTHKIAGDDAEGFADYLTCDSRRGDYYIDAGDPDGDGAAGVWHSSRKALTALGLSHDEPVSRGQLLALMHGRSPDDGSQIRPAGGDGSRVAGIDLTFSPPKSVSALWAACAGERRRQIAEAHRDAVQSAVRQVERSVALVRRREDGALRWERAESLVAAQFTHTSSRLTRGQERDGVPDPQLHTHVVVLAAQRVDGRFAAVDSRELMRSARANSAWYRAVLAENLADLGLGIERHAGNDGRYFEVEGVPTALAEQWSQRAADIERAAREFRDRHGRGPKGAELDRLVTATRGTKSALDVENVDLAWKAVAEEHGLNRDHAERLFADRNRTRTTADEERFEQELLERLTRDRAMVDDLELRAIAYERAAGVCHPAYADRLLGKLERSGELVRLDGGMWTTRTMRERELQAVATVQERRRERAAPVGERALQDAEAQVEGDLGHPLSTEQREAARTVAGPGGVTVLVGQAGTGKGVVLRSAAHAWHQEGYEVIGTAIAGATAERLAADAQLGHATTTDKLIAQAENGGLTLGERTVVMMDEAGMADTKRLAKLIELTGRHDAKLVLAGDSAQLSSIGAGGLFDHLAERAPSAELTQVHRARHEWERNAWAAIREGEAVKALAAYDAHERLHIADTREQAAERMLADWDRHRLDSSQGRTIMLTDASNRELDEINRRAQQYRDRAGELGARRARLANRPYDLAAGDEVIFTKPHYRPGQERVENGTLGTVLNVHDEHTVTISTRGAKAREVTLDTSQSSDMRLAYAQHIYKAQGLTADHAFVLTGGWQTDREHAYVALTRARERTDLYVARKELGLDGFDTEGVQRLADAMSRSSSQEASIARNAATAKPAIDNCPERCIPGLAI